MGNYINVEAELKNNRYWVLGQLDESNEIAHELSETKENIVLGCDNGIGAKLVTVTGKTKRKTEEISNKSKGSKASRQSVKLKCFYVNARSIINKREELELYILNEKPDIIGITETWAVENIGNSELNVEGYTMLRRDRIIDVKLKGGGVLLYIKILLMLLREKA